MSELCLYVVGVVEPVSGFHTGEGVCDGSHHLEIEIGARFIVVSAPGPQLVRT